MLLVAIGPWDRSAAGVRPNVGGGRYRSGGPRLRSGYSIGMFTEVSDHQGLCEVDHGMREGNPGIEVGRGVIELVSLCLAPESNQTKNLFEYGRGLYLVLCRHSTGTGDLLGQLQHVIGSRSARE